MKDLFFPDMSSRSNEPELMDFPDSDPKKLINTVKQFSIINILFTRSRYLIKKYIVKDMLRSDRRSFTFLDIGAGGCDIPLWLLRICKRNNIDIKITCLDNDRRIIEYAKKKCAGLKEIEILEGSAFDLTKMQKFDYIFANHFLHHLSDEQIISILNIVNENTKKCFILSDLLRSWLGYLGYTFFTGIFMHNSFAFYDGRLSIKKSFIYKELKEFVSKMSENKSIIIESLKPSRLAVIGNKNT